MHLAHHRSIPRGTAARVLLALLVCGAAVGLTRCKLVTDELTRVRVSPFAGASDCLHECAQEHHDAIQVEVETHRENVQACGDDPVCQEREDARHDAAVKAITAAFKECRNGCHHQGGGHGGD